MANYKSVIAAAVAVCMMAGGIFLDTSAAQNDSADVKETTQELADESAEMAQESTTKEPDEQQKQEKAKEENTQKTTVEFREVNVTKVPFKEDKDVEKNMFFTEHVSLANYNELSEDRVYFKDNKCFNDYLQYKDLGELTPVLESKDEDRFHVVGGNILEYDGRYYYFYYKLDPYRVLPEGAVNPVSAGVGVTYIMPSEQDKNVGDLYYWYSYCEVPKRIAKDVDISTDYMAYISDDQYYFIYSKTIDGKKNLMKSYVIEDDITTKETKDYTVTEEVFVAGNCIPLNVFTKGAIYYDLDKKEMYYTLDGNTRLIYSGEYDRYYVNYHSIMIILGDKAYYFGGHESQKEAVQIMDGGFDNIFNIDEEANSERKGYPLPNNVVIIDKSGKEYLFRDNHGSGKGIQLFELSHKVEDPGVELFGYYLTFIEDGKLYYEEYLPEGVEKYIKFDTEKAVDYCYSADGQDFIIYTESGNLYCQEKIPDKEYLLDTQVDKGLNGIGCNMTFLRSSSGFVYSKGGKFIFCDISDPSRTTPTLNGEKGYFVRDNGITYFVYEGAEEEDYQYFYLNMVIYRIM